MSGISAVWCRRTDELVDGPNASHITPQALDRWEKRLEDLFAGRPYDMLDAALSDTITKFPIDIQVRAVCCICSSALHVSVYSESRIFPVITGFAGPHNFSAR
jgi:hypothetical protein